MIIWLKITRENFMYISKFSTGYERHFSSSAAADDGPVEKITELKGF